MGSCTRIALVSNIYAYSMNNNHENFKFPMTRCHVCDLSRYSALCFQLVCSRLAHSVVLNEPSVIQLCTMDIMYPTNCCTLYILNSSCRLLLRRDWRGESSPDCLERFSRLFLESEVDSDPCPIMTYASNKQEFFHVRHNDLIFVCVGHRGSNPALIFAFIHSLIDILKQYFGQIEEESIRDNFVLIYELLDEIMDHGYPQYTEGSVLRKFITLNAYRLDAALAPATITNTVSWRPEGIVHAKNEIFLDVIERCSMHVNSFGEVVNSSLTGGIEMKVQLSGMPECRLGLNDRLSGAEGTSSTRISNDRMEDVKFHRCVKLHDFKADKTIGFIPPDGRFELMSYRFPSKIEPLIWLVGNKKCVGATRVRYSLKLSARFKERFIAQDVRVMIPVESDATKPEVQCKLGTVTYIPEKEAVLWHIKNLQGGKEVELALLISVPSVQVVGNVKSKHMTVCFEIPYFTPSGLQVRYLKVFETSGYSALPWVRYLTRSGSYTFKMN